MFLTALSPALGSMEEESVFLRGHVRLSPYRRKGSPTGRGKKEGALPSWVQAWVMLLCVPDGHTTVG